MPSDPVLELKLFGDIAAFCRGELLPHIRGAKNRGVLAYLALKMGNVVSHDDLRSVFWSDTEAQEPTIGKRTPEQQRLSSVTTALSYLRKRLEHEVGLPPEAVLERPERGMVRMCPAAVRTDLQQFVDLRRSGVRKGIDSTEGSEILLEAARLHRGMLCARSNESEFRPYRVQTFTQFCSDLEALTRSLTREQVKSDVLPLIEDAVRMSRQNSSTTFELYTEPYVLLIRTHLDLSGRRSARRWCKTLRRDIQRISGKDESPEDFLNEPDLDFIHSVEQPKRWAVTPTTPETGGSASAGDDSVAGCLARTRSTQLTNFFGREREMSELMTLVGGYGSGVSSGEVDPIAIVRLVTITGAPGDGKSRLAAEVAAKALPFFNGHVGIVTPDEAGTICHAVADALGIGVPRHTPAEDVVEDIADRLPDSPVLLILDDLEPLLKDHDGNVSRDAVLLLLNRIPGLRILGTSRTLVGIAGEREYMLAPLPVPAEDALLAVAQAYPSVRLLMDRVQAVKGRLPWTDGDIHVIANLCRKLDGAPLALELLAAWARDLDIGDILNRVNQRRLKLLVSQQHQVNPRLRSLDDSIRISYALVPHEVQRTFTCLAVFHGGLTADSAATVADEPLAEEHLRYLHRHSLVELRSGTTGAPTRYQLREVIREFADGQLSSEERKIAESRHAAYFHRFVHREGRIDLLDPDWVALVKPERRNIAASARWFEAQDPLSGLRLLNDTAPCWLACEDLNEGLTRLGNILQLRPPDAPKELVASAARWAGTFAAMLGVDDLAMQWCDIARPLYSELHDSLGLGTVLNILGGVSRSQGEYDNSCEFLQASIDTFEEIAVADADKPEAERFTQVNLQLAQGYTNLAYSFEALGRYEDAEAALNKSLLLVGEYEVERQKPARNNCLMKAFSGFGILASARRDYGSALRWHLKCRECAQETSELDLAVAEHNIGAVYYARGEFPAARERFEEAYRLRKKHGERVLAVTDLLGMGQVDIHEGDYAEAIRRFREVATLCGRLGFKDTLVILLSSAGDLAADMGDLSAAVELWGIGEWASTEWKIKDLESTSFDEMAHAQRIAAAGFVSGGSLPDIINAFCVDKSKLAQKVAGYADALLSKLQ